MLGRPMIWCPVFMKICAGAWLNCVVFIERTMAISSACFCRLGSSSEISAPDWPCCLNVEGRAEQARRALDEREALAFGDEPFGISWPSYLLQQRLVVEQIELRRRAGHEQVDDLLGLRREVRPDRVRELAVPPDRPAA